MLTVIDIPIFRVSFVLCTTRKDTKRVAKKTHDSSIVELFDTSGGFVGSTEPYKGRSDIIMGIRENCITTIAHESAHMAILVQEITGMYYPEMEINNELNAYLTGFISNAVCKALVVAKKNPTPKNRKR